jgi:hypothetical protein
MVELTNYVNIYIHLTWYMYIKVNLKVLLVRVYVSPSIIHDTINT